MDAATDSFLRKLSMANGNPAGMGGAAGQTESYVLGQVGLPAWQAYTNQNAAAGGLGNISSASPQSGAATAAASGNIYNSVGKSIGALTNPTIPISQLLSMNGLG
jgi:hypothetical protein